MNRREFLKTAGATTAVAGAALAVKPKEALALELGVKHDAFPREVTSDFKGFRHKNNIFMRMYWDQDDLEPYVQETFGYKKFMDMRGKGAAYEDIPGFGPVERALSAAAWSVCNNFAPNSANGMANTKIATHAVNHETGEIMKDQPVLVESMHSWNNSSVDQMIARGQAPHQFKSPEDAAKHVKKAAKVLGADLVGIAPYNESTKRWTYKEWSDTKFFSVKQQDGSMSYSPYDMSRVEKGLPPAELVDLEGDFKNVAGFEPKSVIVLAFEMDYEAIKAAPTKVSSSAVGMGYSRMSETAYKVAQFLRKLGYRAIPCGNDTGISVPLAMEAGLGEGSRMGLLITEKYGPRVRLSKVYTDLEIAGDKPITFGVKEFCNVCMKCADACPSNAISHEPTQVIKEGMEFDSGKVNASTMTGVEKWFVNAVRCYAFWKHSGGDCATCVAVCPYNKIDEWHHDLSKLMTLTPFKSLLRSMDEWFGYGGPIVPEERIESKYIKDAVEEFWNNL